MKRSVLWMVRGVYYIQYHELFGFVVMKNDTICFEDESRDVINLFWG